MELRHLAAFVAVAEERSFTRASTRLQIVQSAVSSGVRTLERELGTSLFERTPRKVSLTEAGAALLPEAHRALAAIQAAVDAVDHVRGGLRGTINLGIMQAEALTRVNIAALLAAFHAQHPQVALHAVHINSAEMATRVRDGRMDFGLLALPSSQAQGLHLTAIEREPMPLAVWEHHPLAGRAVVELADVAGETFADASPTFGLRAAVDQAFLAAGLQRQVALQVNDTSTVVDLVRHELAVAFVAPSLVRDLRGVVLVDIRGPAPTFESYLAEPTNRKLSAAADALLDLTKQHIGAGL